MKILPATVEKVVQDYISQLNSIIPQNIVGVYLTGSVSLGDYYTRKSDIDFITVTLNEPAKDAIHQLKNIHQLIEKKHNNPKLNGYYITTKGIINNITTFPSFFKNKMYTQRPFELKNFSLFELKFFSYHAYGLPVIELPINVQLEDVIKELHDNINDYWTTWVQKHSTINFNQVLLILFPRLTEWGLLGVARQLYTLNTGSVTSKLLAGSYYLERVPNEFRSIMATAIETRRLNKTELKPSMKRADGTLKCMKWIITEFNKTYDRH
jgi:hypothetical protein